MNINFKSSHVAQPITLIVCFKKNTITEALISPSGKTQGTLH